jgi:DNA-binding transcriptional MerR regulator
MKIRSQPKSKYRPQTFRTAEVLEESGISRQMLSNYAQLGLITEAQRTDAGQRLYGPDVFNKIGLIRRLIKAGYTLRDIREIFFRDRAKPGSGSGRLQGTK